MLVRAESKNRLLSSMGEAEFALLAPLLVPVALPLRKVLQSRGRKIENVFFPEDGLASVVASAGSDRSIEVGVVGREGVTGLSLIMGVDISPCDTFMQSPGHGWSLGNAGLRQAMTLRPALRDHLLLFGHTMILQMAFTALSNGKYSVGERLARWLLMAQDRCSPGPIILTHEFLAVMLGVRRPGVTTALSMLEQSGFITTARGSITITNRKALEEVTNGCYGVPEAEFDRLFLPEAAALAS